jgi:ribosome assembly protein RRB1
VASCDNRVSIWDLSVEPDDDQKEENVNVPDQLMFVHQGQQDIKEIRYFLVKTKTKGGIRCTARFC